MHLADSQQMVLDSEQQMRQYDRLVDSWTWQMHPLLHPKGYHHLVVCFVEVEGVAVGVAVGLEVHHLEGHQGCCDQSSMDHRPLEDGGKVLLVWPQAIDRRRDHFRFQFVVLHDD